MLDAALPANLSLEAQAFSQRLITLTLTQILLSFVFGLAHSLRCDASNKQFFELERQALSAVTIALRSVLSSRSPSQVPRKKVEPMPKLLLSLLNDECGFIVSAELVLVATILVIGLVVGLSEIQHAVNAELNDVADAIGSVNQSFFYSGFSARKSYWQMKSMVAGSSFEDQTDDCDNNQCDISCDAPRPERYKN